MAEQDRKGGSHADNAAAAVETWQLTIYRKVDREMGLAAAEFEDEMKHLRTLIDALRLFRRRLLGSRFD